MEVLNNQSTTTASVSTDTALFSRQYTTPSESPFDAIGWEKRSCKISSDKGAIIFEQHDVEVPSFWSVMASTIVASKYLRGELGSPERETSVRQLISRVVDTIELWGCEDGYLDHHGASVFNDELTHILLHQKAAFNSPVWFNLGIHPHPQCSACFIVSTEDSLDSLLRLQTIEARLFKFGSGTGTNLSSIRSSKEKLSGGGVPSGPVSFMKGFDAWAGVIRSGGKTRRAAKMQILNCTHPDIREFITCKSNEERKAWALIEQGYDGGFATVGGAYEAVAFQNANLSVRVTDDFMQAVLTDGLYSTKNVTNGEPCEELSARAVLRSIAEATHICGDPGLQFDTTINEWHTCPESGRINASNPCSEYMHVDNSACNLASINLLTFLDDQGEFDIEAFKHTVRVLITAQDTLIDRSSYPTTEIATNASAFRQLGLGYANLGALLMSLGLPYDSDQGRAWAAAITALMSGEAYATSARLAEKLGAFSAYSENSAAMNQVIRKHQDALDTLTSYSGVEPIISAARQSWSDAVELGEDFGFRNSQVTVLAPTGTISFLMDCDTTGIEPDIALVKYKKLVGGGALKIVNHSVTRALKTLGYAGEAQEAIVSYIEKHDTIEGCPELRPAHLPVFDCAFRARSGTRSIHYSGHLRMMAAVQPFISGAISKTVNLPNDATVDEIFQVYVAAWEMGLKAVALYRDGSKRTQPLTTTAVATQATTQALPQRKKLPDVRQAVTHKFQCGGVEGYLTVGLYPDNTPGEIFVVVSKEGSTLSGIMDAFATAISIALQYGVPLATLVRKFSYSRFEPAGFTGNPEIPIAHSLIDYLFRWLANRFLNPQQILDLGLKFNPAQTTLETNGASAHGTVAQSRNEASVFTNSVDAPPCSQCGSLLMVRQAGCYVCLSCGTQGGCG